MGRRTLAQRRFYLLVTATAIGAAISSCAAVGSHDVPTPPPRYRPFRHLTLPSGLTVFAEDDRSVPVAGLVWSVRCGGANDPPGREGLAHAVEHLVFRAPGTAGVARRERLLGLGAAELNAETGFDDTTFHTFAPESASRALLDIELAAMADPLAGIDQETFALEMEVVREELSFRDQPGDKPTGREALERAVFPVRHPYTRPVGGTAASLDAITLADARAFARGCYQPRNMVLVLSGPGAPGWTDALPDRLPASLRGDPGHPVPPRLPPAIARGAYPSPPPANEAISAPIRVPEVWVGWALPPAVGADERARHVLARLVNGLLHSGLENAADADNPQLDSGRMAVSVTGGQLGGMLACWGRLPVGSTPTDEANAIIEQVSSLWLRLNEDQAWFERVRLNAIADAARALGDVVVRARSAAALLETDLHAKPNDILKRTTEVSYLQALEWARNYLRPERARIVKVNTARPMLPAAAAAAVPAAAARPAGARSWQHHAPATAAVMSIPLNGRVTDIAKPIGAARAVTRQLANGLTATVLRRAGAPLTYVMLGFHASPRAGDDPAVRAAFPSAREFRYERRPGETGIDHRYHGDRDSIAESIEVLAGHEDEALAFLGRAVEALAIDWPSERFRRRATLERVEENLPGPRAERAFASKLWGGHAYGAHPSLSDVEHVETGQLERWLERVHRPANGTLIVVGDVDPDQIFPRIDQAVGRWAASDGKVDANPPPPPALPALRAQGSLRVIAQPVAGRPSAALHFGCLLPEVRDETQWTVNRLLARLLEDRLFDTLRLQTGASYVTRVQSSSFRGGAATLDGWADVQTPALRFAVETVQALLNEAAPSPIDAAALEQVRWAEARTSNLRYRTSDDLARALFHRWNMGWPVRSLDELPARLEAVTLSDMAAALRACRANAVLTVVGDTSSLAEPPARAAN